MLAGIAAWKLLAMIGLIFVIAEPVIPGFVVLPIGLAFLATAVVAVFAPTWIILLPVLAVFEVLTFTLFQTVLKKHLGKTSVYTNAEGMVGQECEVIESIGSQSAGCVKLYGDQWVAKTDCGVDLKKGAKVLIARVDGNKVWVEPISGKEESWSSD